jgi:hypothetical protein
MQQRTVWIIVGVIGAVSVLVCSVIGVGGFFVYRELQQQQQRVADLQATLVAEDALVAPTSAPMATAPRAAPTPTQEAIRTEPTRSTASPAPTTSTDAADLVTPVPPPAIGDAADLASALAAEGQGALAQFPGAPLYRIDARFDPDGLNIAGAQTVRVTNTEDGPLNEIYFRLAVNASHYKEGGIDVANVLVDGQPATTAMEIDDTALKVTLPQPLAQGQSVEISIQFTTTIPTSGGGYGIFGESDGIFSLYNWHPELGVYEGGGWQLNPITDQGDPNNTDAANYVVTFAAPEGYKVITSGVEREQPPTDGQVTHEITSALTRNFVIVAGEQFEQVSQQVGNVEVVSHYLSGNEQGAQSALDTAAGSIEVFSKQFGPYPYAELDIAEVKLGGGAAGMESTGLIMIGSEYYDPQYSSGMGGASLTGMEGADVLAFVTAHEVGHQWWYSVVGSNAYAQPWLDEGLTNWVTAFYIDQAKGNDAGLIARDLFIRLPYQMVLFQGDMRLDQPVDEFNQEEYGGIVYGKGALMYDVLRQEIGEDKFFDFLDRYYQKYQFQRVDGAGWRATLAEVVGQDVADAFYTKWVEGDSITADDLPEGGPMSQLFDNGLGGLEQLLPTPSN